MNIKNKNKIVIITAIIFIIIFCVNIKIKKDKEYIKENIKMNYGYDISDNNLNKILFSKEKEINKCIVSEDGDPRYYDLYYEKIDKNITFYTKIGDVYKPMSKIKNQNS